FFLMVSVSAWAAPGDIISVDNWTEYPVGALLLSVPGTWKIYSSMKVFKYPPTVVLDDARRAVRLKTDHETMAIGRSFPLDVATTRTLPVGVEAVGAASGRRRPGTCRQAE